VFCIVRETTGRVLSERHLQTLRDLAARSAEARTEDGACQLAAETLAANAYDIPFAMLYLLDRAGERAQLAGVAGIAVDTAASPREIALAQASDSPCGWPFAEVMADRRSRFVDDLSQRFGLTEAKLPGGPWPESPEQAMMLPLARAGQEQSSSPLAGFLIAGVSPRRAFDDEYRGFFALVAGQVTTAIANAHAYEEERQRAEALAEIDRAKTAFFSNVSHEFRTPLTLMLGPIEDTLAEDQLPSRAHERLEVAHRNSLRLLKLVNTLLDFSRIEAGRIQAVYEPVDLATFTADLASVFRSTIERAGMSLIIDCPPLSRETYVDREMWEKIVLNLLSNAFKFTFEGQIEVSLKPAGESVELTVRDTGVGIASKDLPQLFERFHRVADARGRTYEGSGIGLALVQELVKLHGGTVRVESEPGVGSAFIVSIPFGLAHLPTESVKTNDENERSQTAIATNARAFVEEALRWLPAETISQTDGETRSVDALNAALPIFPSTLPSISPARILLADDNSDMREYVRRLLAANYEVEAVADGEAALQAARERPPDLVLSDVMMPKLDGFGLLKALREDERLATIPVILLSARAGEDARLEGLQAGADDYLIKPFSARELLARVRAHLEMARLRREAEMALRYSEKLFRELADNAPLIIWMTDGQGNNEFVNKAYQSFFGVAPEEVAERRWTELVHPDDYETYVQKFLDVSAACLPFRAEARVRRADGEWRWLDSYAVPRSTESGHTPGMIGCSADITERKRAEDAMGQLATIVESSDEAIYSNDLNDVIMSWNKGAEKLFGYAAEEVIGKSIMIVIPPDRADEEIRVLESVRRGEKIDHYETMRRRKDGALVEISLKVSPLRDKAGNVIGASKIARDITERKRVEAALAEGARQQRALYQLADHLHRARSLDDIYNAALDAILSSLQCDRASISLFDDAGVMRFAGWRGLSDGYRKAVEGYSSCKSDERCLEPICVNNVDLAEIDDSHKDVIKREGIGALAYIPLVSRGKLIGKFMTYFNAPHVFSDDELALSLTIARQLAFGVERKRAEKLLRQNAAQLALIANSAPVFIAHCDTQARYKFVNKPYAERLGLTPEDCIGKLVPEVVGEEAYRSFGRHVEAALRGEPVEFEVEIPYEVIGKHFMHCSYAPEFDADGKVVGFVAAITDISARKQAEEKLIAATAKFESVFNQSGIFAAITDLQGNLREVNDLAVNWCGYTREQVLDQPFWETPWWRGSEDVKARVRAATEQAAAGKVFREELPYWWADGTERMAELAIHPIRDQDGRVMLLHPTGFDITERKRAEEKIARLLAEEQEARDVAEQATRAKDEFLAVVSHELRSPLNAILGWNNMLRSHSGDDPYIARVIETVQRNGKAQLQLIEDLLDTARIITGKMKLEVQPVAPVTVIAAALDTVRTAADSKGIVIATDFDPEAGQLTGDHARLQQVVWNLVSNAIKFTPEGGRVWVELRRSGSDVKIVVRDTGQGIEPDLLPYVFDRFKQGDSSTSRRFGGLGLGLSLVKHLVELHGGVVTVESPGKGQGTTVTVSLPVRATWSQRQAISREDWGAPADQPEIRRSLSKILTGVRALVVDDEDDARELVTLTLEQCGAQVTSVDSAAAALAALESQLEDGAVGAPFDVMICDIGMPGTDGYELIRLVRTHQDKRVSHIKAVALTAYARSEYRLQALRAGFQMYVAKPVDDAELTVVISSLTGRTPGHELTTDMVEGPEEVQKS
jgi:PAS domain S-box-containing protein